MSRFEMKRADFDLAMWTFPDGNGGYVYSR